MSACTKKIAAVTMVRNDDFFLHKWVDYYGACLGRENILVCIDGEDQIIPEFCKGLKIKVFKHQQAPVHQGDKLRIEKISAQAMELMKSYDVVIGGDVDEYLVPDPKTGESLVQMISRIASEHPGWTTISGLGVDVGEDLACETDLHDATTFLSQRSKAKLSTRYTKASVLLKPAAWGSGFHRAKGHNYHIVKDLFLFHFGGADLSRIKSKMSDAQLLADGWSHHLKKRARTITLCTSRKARPWDCTVSMARHIQSVIRPPYSWNKPAMFEAKIVVCIPERFKSIL